MAKVPIYAISQIQLHILTSDPPQLAISVQGTATTPGWTDPELQTVEAEVSADGILDLAFVAEPPTGIVPQVLSPISASLVWTKDVERVIGVRVISRSGDRIQFLNSPQPSPHPITFEPHLISELIGRPVRCYGPGDALTADLRPNRVNIETDQSGRIVRIWYG